MILKIRYGLQVIFVLLNFHSVRAQTIKNTSLTCFQQQFEKVYVHTNKDIYTTGSAIHYKAYVINGHSHVPSAGGTMLYFQLEIAGKAKVWWKTNLTNGMCYGKFILPDSLVSGKYQLRAFTNYLLNVDPAYLFSKNIIVSNPKDHEKKELTYAESSHSAKPYSARLENAIISIDSVELENEQLILHILGKPGIFLPHKMIMNCYFKGDLYYSQPFTPVNGLFRLPVHQKQFSEGVYYFTLSDQFQAVYEKKLIYVSNPGLGLRIQTAKNKYACRDEVEIQLQPEKMNADETAEISVSVSQMPTIQISQAGLNIHSQIHYLSEISENPTTRFNENKQKRAMIVHENPDDYIWNDTALLNKHFRYFNENMGYILSGKISNKITGRPYRNTIVCFSVTGDNTNLKYSTTNHEGIFYFHIDKQLDNKEIYLQVFENKIKHSDILWTIFDKKFDSHLPAVQKEFTFQELSEITYRNAIHLAESSFSLSKENTNQTDSANAEFLFYFTPDMVIFPVEYVELENFTEISQNLLPTVKYKFNQKTGDYSLRIYDAENEISYDQNATVFLNGIILKDLSVIKELGTKDINRIEISNTRVFYGDLTFQGVVCIYTNKKDFAQRYLKENSLVIFNSTIPNYDDLNSFKPPKEAGVPDLRQTLLWEPNLKINSNEVKTLYFSTSDLKGKYLITVNGITTNGRSVHNNYILEVTNEQP